MVLACGVAARGASGTVLTLHSGMVPEFLGGGAYRRALARTSLRHYQRVVCVNLEIRDALAALGVGAERLVVAPAYLPARRPQISLPARLRDWLGQHSPVLSTALFFRPEYGLELLIVALRHLRRRYPRLGCLILGSGSPAETSTLEQQLTRDGMADWALLTGDVSHALCLELMSRSNLFVRPTLVDGDAISVREALALGIPVVASDVGTRPEGVVLFRRGDATAAVAAIERALEQPLPTAAEPEASAAQGAIGAGAERQLIATYQDLLLRRGVGR
jgi:glycosyltransferase involved in cell wall biosynthesis